MKYGFSLNLRKAREAPKQIHTTKWFQCLHYPKYNSQSFGVMLVAACSQQTFQCISTVWSGASRVLFMTKKLNSVEFPFIRGSQGLILTSPPPPPPRATDDITQQFPPTQQYSLLTCSLNSSVKLVPLKYDWSVVCVQLCFQHVPNSDNILQFQTMKTPHSSCVK